MNRGILIGVGALLAVVVAALLFVQAGRGPQPARQTPGPTPAVTEEEEEATPAAQEEVREIIVEGDEYSFSPGLLELSAGETVRIVFRNVGSLPHNFTLEGLGIATRTIGPGRQDTVTVTVEEGGTYTTFCSVGNHRALGMEGEARIE